MTGSNGERDGLNMGILMSSLTSFVKQFLIVFVLLPCRFAEIMPMMRLLINSSSNGAPLLMSVNDVQRYKGCMLYGRF